MSTSLIDALVERGEELGCVNLSEFSELVQDLPEDEAQAVADRLEARGIEVSDDCGRESEPGPSYALDELSTMTGDALQLFLRDIRRHPAAYYANIHTLEFVAGAIRGQLHRVA